MTGWYGGEEGGHIGFSPVIPLTGDSFVEVYELLRGYVEEEARLDFIAGSLVINDRSLVMVAMLLFDTKDAEQTRRAYDVAKRLAVEAGKRGYGEYRAHLDFMDLTADQYGFNDHAYRRFCERIKDAVDPNGILSPGRHGIWPARHARRALVPSGGAHGPRTVEAMRYRKLGSSDLEVSEISLGSWLTYSGGVASSRPAPAPTRPSRPASTSSTPPTSTAGAPRRRAWGEILSGRPRDSYVLATKVWGQMSDDPADRGLSAAQIAKQIDASLARLQTDYVDLYQAHRFDPDVPIEETIEALQRGRARRARRATWASASGRRSRSRRRSRSPGPTCSSPPSRSTRCCGRRPRPRSSRCARRTASRRSSGRRWRRAC